VPLLDYLVGARQLRVEPLPPGSRVMETGGYKNRSRSHAQGGIARAHHLNASAFRPKTSSANTA
jgi:hypothetical protein